MKARSREGKEGGAQPVFARVPAQVHASVCVYNQVFVWAGSYNRAGCSKGTLVLPLTQVNLPCLVLKLST